jgi:hypothetical protein
VPTCNPNRLHVPIEMKSIESNGIWLPTAEVLNQTGRIAYTVAFLLCRGKRAQAVETLVGIAQLDPWLPELDLRPASVANSHRLSVEQAKAGLVWYYNSAHDFRKAEHYHEQALSWRIRRLNLVRFPWVSTRNVLSFVVSFLRVE